VPSTDLWAVLVPDGPLTTPLSSTSDVTVELHGIFSSDASGSPVPPVPSVVLDAHANNFAAYNIFNGTNGPYWSMVNAWNLGGLPTNQYSLTITNFPSTFPAGTVFAWQFGPTPNASNTWGYPEIIFGTQAGGGFSSGPPVAPPPKQLNSLGTLSLSYSMSRSFADDGASLLLETWAQTVPKNQSTNTREILFYAYANNAVRDFILNALTHRFDYSVGGLNAYVASANGGGIYIMPVSAPSGTTALDMSNGSFTINFALLLAALVSNGLVSGTDFISGFEFGFEVTKNAGGAIVNSLVWNWS